MRAHKKRGCTDINPIDISNINNNKFIEIISSDAWCSSSDSSFEDKSSITKQPTSPTKPPNSATKQCGQKKQNLGTQQTCQIDWSSKEFFLILGNLFFIVPIEMTTDGVFVPQIMLQSVMN